jgi:hypothetical protein
MQSVTVASPVQKKWGSKQFLFAGEISEKSKNTYMVHPPLFMKNVSTVLR